MRRALLWIDRNADDHARLRNARAVHGTPGGALDPGAEAAKEGLLLRQGEAPGA